MKKLFFAVIAFCCSYVLQAQDKGYTIRHEIYANIGFAVNEDNLPECNPMLVGWLDAPLIFKDQKYTNIISVGYMLNLSNRWGLGISYSTNEMEGDLWLNAAANKTASVDARYKIFMLNTRYKWLVRRNFTLYSRVGLGSVKMSAGDPVMTDATFNGAISEWEDKSGFAWQVVPVGAQYVFFKHLGIFAEGGIGVESSCSVGVKLLF